MNENTCVSGYKTRNTLQGRKPRRYFPVSVPKRQIVINLNFSLKCLKLCRAKHTYCTKLKMIFRNFPKLNIPEKSAIHISGTFYFREVVIDVLDFL